MRPLLVLDTCGQLGYVALVDADTGDQALSEHTIAPRETQEHLLPAIQRSLADAGIGPGQLAALAVVTGPGSFTGVRVGLAVAKGLAQAASLPMVACSRLAVLAQAALPGLVGNRVTAWLDAGRTDIYAGMYTLTPTQPPVCVAEQMLSRAAAIQALTGPVVVTEPALSQLAPKTVVLSQQQTQQATLALALSLFHAGLWADPVLVDANYLRVPDAELAQQARQAAA